jgi:hypothetical protein
MHGTGVDDSEDRQRFERALEALEANTLETLEALTLETLETLDVETDNLNYS